MGKGTPSLSHALVCPGVTQVMDAVLSRLACHQHDLLLLYYPGQQKVVCVIKSVEHRTVSLMTNMSKERTGTQSYRVSLSYTSAISI